MRAVGAWAWLVASSCVTAPGTPAPPVFDEVAGLTQPELVAFNPEDDLTARVTADGRFVVFVSERNGNLDVWVRDYGRDSTYPLTRNPADDFDPAVFPGGRRLVFVSRRSDAKGDLFIASSLEPGASVERLTDATTQDRQPVVSPDGQRVYFTAAAGIGLEFIAELDLDSRQIKRLSPTSGFDPTVSADGRFVVYTAPAEPGFTHPHLVALRLTDNATRALTRGDTPAGFATFVPSSSRRSADEAAEPADQASPYALAFVRFADDDNGDGQVDARDQASLWRMDVDLDGVFNKRVPPSPYPLTDGGSDELFPDAGDGRLYFTQGADQQDILRLPPTGTFPVYPDPAQYLALADVVSNPRTRWFALRSAVARAGVESLVGAQAMLAAGRHHLSTGAPWLARRDFGRLIDACRSADPGSARWILGGLAQVESAALDRADALVQATGREARRAVIRSGRRRIEGIATRFGGVNEIRSRIELEQAELLIAEGARTRAILALESIALRDAGTVAARAMLRRIELLGIVYDPEALSEAYAQVTTRFPKERAVVLEAATRLVDVQLQEQSLPTGAPARLDALRRIVGRFPPGPIRQTARWRLATELRSAGTLDSAALELAQLVEESSEDRVQTARAQRALAEVNEARGAGDAAVEGWRRILRQYADLPGFGTAARAAISRVNLAAAAASEQRGDLEGARQAYRRVIENDVGAVEAHRRYTALSARLGRLDEVLARSKRRADRSRDTPVARYAYGLALTWRQPPALDDALEQVEASIALNPQFTEAYLLRGWIREMQELEEPSWFVETVTVLYERVIESVIAVFASDQEEVGQLGLLELAIEDYKTALRLNNESLRPRTEAEILLNLGNGQFRLADDTNDPPNMRQAFDRYAQVVALGYRFDTPEAEMVFWERFGRAGSWVGAHALSAMATRKALVLAERLQADKRRLQQLGNLALTYDQADEEAYAQDARRALDAADQSSVAAGRAAIRLREKARARMDAPSDRNREGFEEVLSDLALARAQLDRIESDPRDLPTLWVALAPDPTSAQYGFGPRDERNVNLALAEQTHRDLGDVTRADGLAAMRSELAKERFEDIPGAALGFVNKWPVTLLQVRERLGLLMVPARKALRAGQWAPAWRSLRAADEWLSAALDGNLVSGSPTWLWLERARWSAIVAAWQARARAEGWARLDDEPPVDETLATGRAAIGRALALVSTATATEPLPAEARQAAWRTPRTAALDETVTATGTFVWTASIARGRSRLSDRVRSARALAARLRYAEGLNAWAESRRIARPERGPTASADVRALLRRLDDAASKKAEAAAHFLQSARWAAGAGPGLGHRLTVLSLAAWAELAPPGAEGAARTAVSEATALAEAIGDERLAWAVRLEAAQAGLTEMPDLDGLWPGFIADDIEVVRRLLTKSASAALARGDVADGFEALDRSLTLEAAAGPFVEIQNRRAPDERIYSRQLRAALDNLEDARRALAETTPADQESWLRLWARTKAALTAVRTVVVDGEFRLSSSAQVRVLGQNQSPDSFRFDLGPGEALVLPADVDGRLHLFVVDGSTTAPSAVTHAATDVAFSRVRTDLDAVWADLQSGQPADPETCARLRGVLFAPVADRVRDKRTVAIAGGFLGRAIPRAVWPDGPVLSYVYSASAWPGSKDARQVGGRGRLRVASAGSGPPMIEAPALSVSEVIEFRSTSPPRTADGDAFRLEARRPAEVLPHRLLELLVVEAPLSLEPMAPERSVITVAARPRLEDAFLGELPIGGLSIAAQTVVLARTGIATKADAAAALRLDVPMAVAGYPTAVVIPDSVPTPVARTLVERLAAAGERSVAAALTQAQDSLRSRVPAVDLAFVVGSPGMSAQARRAFAQKQLRPARSGAVAALSRKNYELAIPQLERWIRLQRASGEQTRRTEGIYGALVGVLRDKIRPPRPAQAADVQSDLLVMMKEREVEPLRRANSEIDLGHLLSRAGDYDAAKRAFNDALETLSAAPIKPGAPVRKADPRLWLARGWYYYGLHELAQRNFAEAARRLEGAISIYARLGIYSRKSVPGEARRALVQVGQLYMNQLGDPALAQRAFERVRRYATEPNVRVSAEIDLARVARRRGAFIDAAAHANTARAEAVRLGLVELELVAEIEAANVAWYQGDYRLGQELCGRTLQTADRLAAAVQRKGPVAARVRPRTLARRKTFALSVCGLVAMSQRDFDGAVGYLETARSLAERLQDDREVATQLNNLGRVYLEFGRLETAVDTFRRALAIDRRLDDRYAQAYDLRNLGRALALQGIRARARDALTQALDLAQEVRDANNELRALFALAQLDRDEGRRAEAVRGMRAALPLAERLQVKELQWQIHRTLGRLAWEGGELSKAAESLERAVRIARSITGRSAPSEFAPDRFEAFDDLLRLKLAQNDEPGALQVSEEARRLRQLELLTDARIQWGDRRNDLQALRTNPTSTTSERVLARLAQTAPQIAALWQPTHPERLSSRLPADAAVIQYEITGEGLIIFILSSDGLKVRTANVLAPELRDRVTAYARQLAARADLTESARALSRWLLEPILPLVANKRRLGFVLQDVLRYLALPALPVDGRSALIDRFEIVRAIDLSAAVDELADPRALLAGSLVALGAAPPPPGAADRPLRFADRELDAIVEEHPGTRLVRGAAVTRARVLQELARPSAGFHFAGHSYLAGAASADRLDDLLGGQLRTADGGVTVLDLLQNRIRADVVVLSACSSLLGQARPGVATGEDLLSMAEGLHVGGAGAVIGSTLNVDDVATALLMKRFYRAARRESLAAALRSAQKTARALYGHPAWWAGFTLWVGPRSRQSDSSSVSR